MECPDCADKGKVTHLRVLETRDSGHGVRRRRECPDCHQRFTSIERLAPKSNFKKSPKLTKRGQVEALASAMVHQFFSEQSEAFDEFIKRNTD